MINFSVIIPHYNSVCYLKKLIRSIPIDDAIQVIVVDDKSQEDISEAESFVVSRGGLFIHNTTAQKGAGVCRNLGLKEAKGKWLVFADADDYFLDDAFDKMQKYAESDAEIVYFIPTSRYIDSAKEAERHIENKALICNYQQNPSLQNEVLLKYYYRSPCSKIVKNEMVKKHNIEFDEVSAANDVMFSMKSAYYAGKVEVSSEVIYCITSAAESLSVKYSESNLWTRVKVFKERYYFLKERLTKEEFVYLQLSGLSLILFAVKKGYGMGCALKIYKYMRENKIKVFSWHAVRTTFLNVFSRILKRISNKE